MEAGITDHVLSLERNRRFVALIFWHLWLNFGKLGCMKTLEQFLSEYFQERTIFYEASGKIFEPIHRRFFAPGSSNAIISEDRVERSRSEKILSVSQADGEIIVVTSGMPDDSNEWPLRYHLRPNRDSWQIQAVEWECLGCSGTGKLCGELCFLCGGKGWQSNKA